MSYKKIYTFSDTRYGETVTFDIYEDTADARSVDTIELIGLTQQLGVDTEEIDTPILGSKVTVDLIDKDYSNNGFVFDKLRTLNAKKLRCDINISSRLYSFRGYPVLENFTRELDEVSNLYRLKFKVLDGFFILQAQDPIFDSNYADTLYSILNSIGHELGIAIYGDLEEQTSTETNRTETFNVVVQSGNRLEELKSILRVTNSQLAQVGGVWVVSQRDWFPTGLSFTRDLIDTSGNVTQNSVTVPSIKQTITDDDYTFGGFSDLSPGKKRQISIYGFNYGVEGFDAGILGTDEDKYTLSGATETSGTITLNSASDTATGSWGAVVNTEKNDSSLDINIQIDGNPASGLSADTTYSLGCALVTFNADDGTTYWLDGELDVWESSETYFIISFVTDGSGNVFGTPSVSISNADFPYPDGNKTGYIEVKFVFVDGEGGGTTGGFDSIEIASGNRKANDNKTGFTINKASATGGFEYNDVELQKDIIVRAFNGNYTAEEDFGLLSLPFVKLAEWSAFVKVAQQNKTLRKLTLTLESPSFDILLQNFYRYDLIDYKLLTFNYDVFSDVYKVVLIEYNYDETGITVERGIYTPQ
jgi:hypothetical protein